MHDSSGRGKLKITDKYTRKPIVGGIGGKTGEDNRSEIPVHQNGVKASRRPKSGGSEKPCNPAKCVR